MKIWFQPLAKKTWMRTKHAEQKINISALSIDQESQDSLKRCCTPNDQSLILKVEFEKIIKPLWHTKYKKRKVDSAWSSVRWQWMETAWHFFWRDFSWETYWQRGSFLGMMKWSQKSGFHFYDHFCVLHLRFVPVSSETRPRQVFKSSSQNNLKCHDV